MRVIHILRKPLGCDAGSVAANTLKYGCGGMNIDGTRIATALGEDTARKPSLVAQTPAGFGIGVPMGGRGSPLGRWPANLILEHLEGCASVGMVKIKGGNDPRHRDGTVYHGGAVYGDGLNGTSHESSHTGFSDADGMETVPAWDCSEGCPVKELDEQAGDRPVGGGLKVARKSAKGREGNNSAGFGAESRPEGTPMVAYGDRGGASRFFKQVK